MLLSERTELHLISLAVIALLLVVLIGGAVGLNLSTSISTAAILAALFALLRVGARIYDVEDASNAILAKVQRGTNVQRFRTYPEFYEALASALPRTERSMRLTHIRDDPPDAFSVDSGYYSDVERWAERNPGCPARRVIAVNNDRMREWAMSLKEIEDRLRNFNVRVTSRSAGLPVINMAILDEARVFLAISGESPEETAGVAIEDPEVGRYFADYFDHLWARSQPLAEAVKEPPREMGTA